jgi:hypothetical protein
MIGISQRDRRRRIHEALGWFEAMKAEKDFKHEARCRAARLGSPWKGSQPYSAAYLKVLKKYWFTTPYGVAYIDPLIARWEHCGSWLIEA